MTLGAFSIILDRNNDVLLCKRRDKDLWNLPGGQVELEESPWEAAIREAKEEICVDIAIEKLIGVYFKPEKNDLVFQFVAHITDGIPTLTDEVAEIAYFNKNDLPINTAPLQRIRIGLYFKNPDLICMQNQ